jgi:hypothetical protein
MIDSDETPRRAVACVEGESVTFLVRPVAVRPLPGHRERS